MITIVDYGLGNILAFRNVYKRLNVEVTVARTPTELQGATKLILPGVGSFDHAMELLNASGMREPLDELVLRNQVPVLGVCVGMQMFARSSTEGGAAGLAWIDGEVRKFDETGGEGLLLPHMGWNDVTPSQDAGLFAGLGPSPRFYFLHSYYFRCVRKQDVAATAGYGGEFACAVRAGNIHGVQFHPEKSHHFGARLLMNFAEV